ncbi:MAG TPA: SIS domain-containing protein [Myxococcales bacterium]|jgi:D-sedoheptulose 7-phosphate isomerase/D-glycero-D-manno-heptose 1,7-bisphosphate phosphatase
MASQPEPFLVFAAAYRDRLRRAVDAWDLAALEKMGAVLREARDRGSSVLIAGNGGSAAVSIHAECDLSKTALRDDRQPLRTRSLAANASVLTATANDHGYESVFAHQVAIYGRPGDVLLLVSSGGNSPNVLAACRAARALRMSVVALVGFDGGALREMADVVVHVAAFEYGIVEDMHQACVHLVTQWLRSG